MAEIIFWLVVPINTMQIQCAIEAKLGTSELGIPKATSGPAVPMRSGWRTWGQGAWRRLWPMVTVSKSLKCCHEKRQLFCMNPLPIPSDSYLKNLSSPNSPMAWVCFPSDPSSNMPKTWKRCASFVPALPLLKFYLKEVTAPRHRQNMNKDIRHVSVIILNTIWKSSIKNW